MNLSNLGNVFGVLRANGIPNRRLRRIRVSDAKAMAQRLLDETATSTGRVSMDAKSSGVPKAQAETTPAATTEPVIRLKATDDDLRGKVYVVFVVRGDEETKVGATWREGSTWIGQRVGQFVEDDQIHNESFPTRKAASEWVAAGR